MEVRNIVNIIGNLVEVDLKPFGEGTKSGIVGKIVVAADIDGIENLISLNVLESKVCSTGTVNSKYNDFLSLDKRLNTRVNLIAKFEEGLMAQKGKVIAFNKIKLIKCQTAGIKDVDVANFFVKGFVYSPLAQVTDKAGNFYKNEIQVGISRSAETTKYGMDLIRFNVIDTDETVKTAVKDYYTEGSTVSFSGVLSHIVKVTQEVPTAGSFGNAPVRTYNNTEKLAIITGGEPPLTETAFSETEMDALVAVREEKLRAVLEKADKKEKESANKAFNRPQAAAPSAQAPRTAKPAGSRWSR